MAQHFRHPCASPAPHHKQHMSMQPLLLPHLLSLLELISFGIIHAHTSPLVTHIMDGSQAPGPDRFLGSMLCLLPRPIYTKVYILLAPINDLPLILHIPLLWVECLAASLLYFLALKHYILLARPACQFPRVELAHTNSLYTYISLIYIKNKVHVVAALGTSDCKTH